MFMLEDNKLEQICAWIKDYFIDNGPDCKAVIGISGGKDSSVCAALLCRALDPDRVVAVKMPQGEQSDIADANEIIEYLGITEVYEVNIGPACDATLASLPSGMAGLPQVYTNIPARERMKVLYAIAAAVHGRVCNTCNRSEDYVGYSTKFGDMAGDFSLLSNYTVREVLEIGEMLRLPNHLLYKTPADGLCGQTDENNLGFRYATLDAFLLDFVYPEYEVYQRIMQRHSRNLHKLNPMPKCPKY